MKLIVDDIQPRQRIPDRFAFGLHDPRSHVRLGPNRNPAVRWQAIPDDARSLVLLLVDRSVPSEPDDVNQAGRSVPRELPRVDFHHWVMVDIPPGCAGIAEAECADGVTPHGKQRPPGPRGSRQGLNDYTGWFAADPDMAGRYFGYDGPCPPWNDLLVHDYHFILYATDLDRCPVDGAFGGADVVAALPGHVLAQAEVVGRYAINPDAT